MLCFEKNNIYHKVLKMSGCFDLSDSEEILNESRRGSTVRPKAAC